MRKSLIRSSLKLSTELLIVALALCGLSYEQVLNLDQVVEVTGLPSLMARSNNPTEVLLTSLDTIFHDRGICCGKDSALADGTTAADPDSLKDVAARIGGRHLLSDGRPIVVKADYLAPNAMDPGPIIYALQHQHAALLQWNSHLYVVHGVVYLWIATSGPDGGGGSPAAVIHKLLLWDTRYSDSRREVVFNRDTDDVAKLQGFLLAEARLQ